MRLSKLLILWLLIGGLLVLLLSEELAIAQYPIKPITVIVGFSPGGTQDVSARILSSLVQVSLGKPIIIVNKPGASAALAIGELTRAKPDGYTLGLCSLHALVLNPHTLKVAYSYKDLTPIVATHSLSQGLCVRTDSPLKTFKEFIGYTRKHPGLPYAAAGAGGGPTLIMSYVAKKQGIDIKCLPFTGGAPAATALLGGHVDFLAGSGSHMPFVNEGKFRLLAVFMDERLKSFSEIPTMSELGYPELPGGAIHGIFAPKGIPEDVRKTLERAFTNATKSNAFAKFLIETDTVLTYATGVDTEKLLEEEYVSWGKIVKEVGLLSKGKE